jgi:hypothetical protein
VRGKISEFGRLLEKGTGYLDQLRKVTVPFLSSGTGQIGDALHPADLSFLAWGDLPIFMFRISYHYCTVNTVVIRDFEIPFYLLLGKVGCC